MRNLVKFLPLLAVAVPLALCKVIGDACVDVITRTAAGLEKYLDKGPYVLRFLEDAWVATVVGSELELIMTEAKIRGVITTESDVADRKCEKCLQSTLAIFSNHQQAWFLFCLSCPHVFALLDPSHKSIDRTILVGSLDSE